MENPENKDCENSGCEYVHRVNFSYYGLDVFCIYGEKFIVGNERSFILARSKYLDEDCLFGFDANFIFEYLIHIGKLKNTYHKQNTVEAIEDILNLAEVNDELFRLLIGNFECLTKYIFEKGGISSIINIINSFDIKYHIINDVVIDNKVFQRYCWNDSTLCFRYV